MLRQTRITEPMVERYLNNTAHGEIVFRAHYANNMLDLPAPLFGRSFFKFSISLASFLLSLASCMTCSCKASTVFFSIWSSTLAACGWRQSLAGTLKVYTQPELSVLVLCPLVTHTTETSKLKCRIYFIILTIQPPLLLHSRMLFSRILAVTL